MNRAALKSQGAAFRPLAIALPAVVLFAVPIFSNAGSVYAAGDADRGKLLFEKRCTGCHSLDLSKEGPPLRNVYGRQAGSVANFDYSDALKATHVTWNADSLDKWLTDTDSVAPDNNMDFRVPNADERADIIRYLKVSSGK
jgi:cytochrome c